MKTFSKLSILAMTFLVPSFVLAQQYLQPVDSAVKSFGKILESVYNITFVLAVIAFVGGVAWFIYQKARGESPEKGFLIWGLIGLAVIFSFYGIIRIFRSVIGVSDNSVINTPSLPRAGGTPVPTAQSYRI
jgi:hypothetical protein